MPQQSFPPVGLTVRFSRGGLALADRRQLQTHVMPPFEKSRMDFSRVASSSTTFVFTYQE
jgi:hypothetical protein